MVSYYRNGFDNTIFDLASFVMIWKGPAGSLLVLFAIETTNN